MGKQMLKEGLYKFSDYFFLLILWLEIYQVQCTKPFNSKSDWGRGVE